MRFVYKPQNILSINWNTLYSHIRFDEVIYLEIYCILF